MTAYPAALRLKSTKRILPAAPTNARTSIVKRQHKARPNFVLDHRVIAAAARFHMQEED